MAEAKFHDYHNDTEEEIRKRKLAEDDYAQLQQAHSDLISSTQDIKDSSSRNSDLEKLAKDMAA